MPEVWGYVRARPKNDENESKKSATINAALIARRFAEVKRATRALESCLKAQGIDLTSE
jgi:hypothetical protein